ncbi:MAG TPA: RHS repeat-associated core domain-containing protein, partial [Actinophytocola sp.]|nr:RHS repeat-associated core domain-containing protein [Actinophytocola sp.]
MSGYDSAGNPLDQMIGIPAGEGALGGLHTTYFAWTTTGLLTGITPVALGGLPGEGITHTYNRYGNPHRTFGYNVYVDKSSYTAYGEAAQYTLGVNNATGWLTFDRDAQTRRISRVNLSVLQTWAQIDDRRYSYDPAGNVTRITNVRGHPDNGATTRTQCFGYDPLARLSEAWTATDDCAAAPPAASVGGADPYWNSWRFEPTGLRSRQVRHAVPGSPGGDTTTTYTYPTPGENAVRPHAMLSTSTTGPAGSSSTGYQYNATGATTARNLPGGNQTLTWNENGRLATVTAPGGTTSYVYDADGNQLIRRDPGRSTLFLPTEEITRDTATNAVSGTRYYTHGGITVATRAGGSNPRYVQSDLHGTAQVSVSTPDFAVTRREFDPYGNPIGAGQGIWPDSHGFLDKPHSQTTGLTDIGARKYDPTTGTFISVDPVLDPASPGQWSGYGYVGGNPVTHSDPSGLFCDSCEFYNTGHFVGVDCSIANGVCQAGRDYVAEFEATTGRNKDPKKQPKIGGHRVPTFEELKKRPGFGHYMNGGTYAEAVQDWAQEICMGPGQDEEFCGAAAALGWLGTGGFDLIGAAYEMTAVADVVNCFTGKDSCLWILANLVPPIKGVKALKYADELADGAKVADNADSAKSLDEAFGFCSFTGNTEVLMADGTHKPIAEVKIGDEVLATDPDTGQQGPRQVTAVLVHDDTVLDLVTTDGATVTTTEDH